MPAAPSAAPLETLITRWLGTEGGAERANYVSFLNELCTAIGVEPPPPKGQGLGDYEFEGPVRSEVVYGGSGTKRIDLYKRDHFILEAKQSKLKQGEVAPPDPAEPPGETIYDLFGTPVGTAPAKGRRPPRYDRLMSEARVQAQRYALALPDGHATPPFLIVCDVGRAFELYFDYAGNGRGYAFFPDQQRYRVTLDQLRDPERLGWLRGIWSNPASVDPRSRAAEVTRDIADGLAKVAAQLERTQRQERPNADTSSLALAIEATSLFLMRLLFCMFAEDVELLPKGKFNRLPERGAHEVGALVPRRPRRLVVADERTAAGQPLLAVR